MTGRYDCGIGRRPTIRPGSYLTAELAVEIACRHDRPRHALCAEPDSVTTRAAPADAPRQGSWDPLEEMELVECAVSKQAWLFQ